MKIYFAHAMLHSVNKLKLTPLEFKNNVHKV